MCGRDGVGSGVREGNRRGRWRACEKVTTRISIRQVGFVFCENQNDDISERKDIRGGFAGSFESVDLTDALAGFPCVVNTAKVSTLRWGGVCVCVCVCARR